MAVNIKFDLARNPEPPTIILATRSGKKLGQLNINPDDIDLGDKLNDASEISFTLNKYEDEKVTNLWDKVVDFKLIYCKEWDLWFEIKVEIDEDTETVKTVFGTQLGQAELSQIMLYNIEINTEDDIARDDFKITILYGKDETHDSLLDRILEKAPHYSIAHVDSTIKNIQRTFSFDDISIYDAFQEIAEEIGCIFIFNSGSDKNGKIQRTISVYDLQQNCNDCGYRGEFTDSCPNIIGDDKKICGSKNITYGYGEDTLIFVTSDELACGGIELTTDTDSVKNCFKLEAGDDLMTATIRNCNPNGSDYIYRFSDDTKDDMSDELVSKIESYDKIYKDFYNTNEININKESVNNYNKIVNKYSVYNKDLELINTPMIGYSSLMNAYYNVIDLILFLESGLMPSVEISKTNASEQAKLLTASDLSPVAVADITIASSSTINNAVLSMAKVIIKSTFKVETNEYEVYDSGNKRFWKGNFKITNYSDVNKEDSDEDKDFAISNVVSVEINDDLESFIKQKIDKELNKENTDDLSITGLFELEYRDFCNELKKYALNPLNSFHDACESCMSILIAQGIGDKESWDSEENNLYDKLYIPYYNKLSAIESEIKIRENDIKLINNLKTYIEKQKNNIQDSLNFEKYLGEELWLEFCSYRREDKYSNENYISDGLDNAELFKKAIEFIEVANNEIYKSSELQHSISTTLNNLLAIDKFKRLIKYFKVGNWIRVQVDDNIYKLRLLEYNISFGSFDNIPVVFSDVTRIKNGITDVKNILSQASSMATSYGYVQRQASQGSVAQSNINDWISNGLNSGLINISNNKNEEILINENGILARSYDDISETYSAKQFRITHNIVAFTDNNWESVRQVIGEHNYIKYDKEKSNFVTDTGYGMTADFITAGYVTGSQIIGGDIYSSNYSSNSGTYINLKDGTFTFAGGNLKYDGTTLSVSGNIESGSTIKGATITGGSLLIGDKKSNYAEITNSGVLNANGANISGAITATSGKIANFTINGGFLYNGIGIGTAKSCGISCGSSLSGSDDWIFWGGNGTFRVDINGNLFASSANITGTITATSGTIGGCKIENNSLRIDGGNITSGTVPVSRIPNLSADKITTGQLSAERINTTGLIAENIYGTTIEGKTISGGSIVGTTVSGVSGTFTTLQSGNSTYAGDYININVEGKGQIRIGSPNYTGYEDITIRPSENKLGNLGIPNCRWDILNVYTVSEASKRDLKENIEVYNTEQAYEELKYMPIYTYFYKDENNVNKTLGLSTMIDYMPTEAMITTLDDNDSYNVSNMIFWNIAASQVMQKKMEDLIIEVNELKSELAEIKGVI